MRLGEHRTGGGRTEEAHHRLAAVDVTSGKYADVFTDDHLDELREEWPE